MISTGTLDATILLRKAHATGLLEYICRELELSETQFKLAEERYRAVGTWLAAAANPITSSATIYPQGSIALGTTVKPIGRDEYDLDLVCLVALATRLTPIELKQTIGERLRINGRYRDILQEKPRCWRLNYAGAFHLDITPSIPNPACQRSGELVPDKLLRRYKPTNPKGYRSWFDACARLQPRIAIYKTELGETRAQIEALPVPTSFRGLLRRSIQLTKRHRDVYFASNVTLAPISIILTTLTAQSYAYCAEHLEYETELDVLVDVLRRMPSFIETTGHNGKTGWFVWNPTTEGENFAEKWNKDAALAVAFHRWHAQAVGSVEQLSATEGTDRVSKHLSESFGDVGSRAVGRLTEAVSSVRDAGRLAVLPTAGLVDMTPLSTQVRRNTFFGADGADEDR